MMPRPDLSTIPLAAAANIEVFQDDPASDTLSIAFSAVTTRANDRAIALPGSI
jgi:hypothetical protein